MKFEPIEVTLKNGTTVTIREAVKKDAKALLETVSTCIIESEYLLTHILEFNPTIQEEIRWIKKTAESRNSLLLVAVVGKKIIGTVDLKGEERKKIRHNALLGIAILKQWQNLGLGKLLMHHIIDWAKENLTLEFVWLHVFKQHDIAIKLYQNFGFTIIATQEKYIKITDAQYADNIIMRLDLQAP